MKAARSFFVALLLLWLAGGCQAGLAPRAAIGGATPDFPLVVVAALAPLLPRRGATLLGFAAGLVHGAVAGADLAGYVVSRTVAGFALGSLSTLELETNAPFALLAGFGATALAGGLFLFVAPPTAIVPYLLGTLGTAVYDAVLAVPALALAVRAVRPPAR